MRKEDKFYLDGMTVCDKLDLLADRLEVIRDLLLDIAYEISKDELGID